jgi:hypothetical protein
MPRVAPAGSGCLRAPAPPCAGACRRTPEPRTPTPTSTRRARAAPTPADARRCRPSSRPAGAPTVPPPSLDTSMRNRVRYGPDCIRRDAGLGRGRSRLPAPGRGSGERRCRRWAGRWRWPPASHGGGTAGVQARPHRASPSTRCGPLSCSRSRGPRSSGRQRSICTCMACPPRTSL